MLVISQTASEPVEGFTNQIMKSPRYFLHIICACEVLGNESAL